MKRRMLLTIALPACLLGSCLGFLTGLMAGMTSSNIIQDKKIFYAVFGCLPTSSEEQNGQTSICYQEWVNHLKNLRLSTVNIDYNRQKDRHSKQWETNRLNEARAIGEKFGLRE